MHFFILHSTASQSSSCRFLCLRWFISTICQNNQTYTVCQEHNHYVRVCGSWSNVRENQCYIWVLNINFIRLVQGSDQSITDKVFMDTDSAGSKFHQDFCLGRAEEVVFDIRTSSEKQNVKDNQTQFMVLNPPIILIFFKQPYLFPLEVGLPLTFLLSQDSSIRSEVIGSNEIYLGSQIYQYQEIKCL